MNFADRYHSAEVRRQLSERKKCSVTVTAAGSIDDQAWTWGAYRFEGTWEAREVHSSRSARSNNSTTHGAGTSRLSVVSKENLGDNLATRTR
jgi:hypothetical protein